MSNGHFRSSGASIAHREASELFPTTELDATIHQHRDAELALAAVDGTDVIVVAPTSMASGYFLTQHSLTAIPVETLSPPVQSHLGDALDAPIKSYKVIQIGKWTADNPNHSLTEFTDA